MWPFGKRIESVFRAFYFLEAKALIINYENLVRGKVTFQDGVAYWMGRGFRIETPIGTFAPKNTFLSLI